MSWLRLYWAQALLGVCAIVAGVIFAWPLGRIAPVVAAQSERYGGPVFGDHKGGVLPGFPLRLIGPGAAEAPPPAAEALPVLVGLANGQAYLRSAATGEIVRVVRGQSIDGWLIVYVGGRRVTLSNGQTEREVAMFTVPPATQAAASVNPGPTNESSHEPVFSQQSVPGL
jgi:hypothetical protein